MLTLEELIAEKDDLAHVASHHFVPFAITGSGDTFYWRLGKPANNRKEQTIYYQERNSADRYLFSKTFAAFLKSVCAGTRLGIAREYVYQPFCKPLLQSQLNKLLLERQRDTLDLLAKKSKIKLVKNR